MAEARIDHTFNCSADTFWDKLFFDEEYNRRMFTEVLRFPHFAVTRHEDRGDRVERTVEVTPRVGDLPGPLKKLVGEGISYREEGVFDRTARRYRINVIPNKLADKIQTRCELFVTPKGPNQCTRTFLCQVEAKIFGVGGLLEKRMLEDIQKSQNLGAEFTNRYIAERGLDR